MINWCLSTWISFNHRIGLSNKHWIKFRFRYNYYIVNVVNLLPPLSVRPEAKEFHHHLVHPKMHNTGLDNIPNQDHTKRRTNARFPNVVRIRWQNGFVIDKIMWDNYVLHHTSLIKQSCFVIKRGC